MSINQPLVSIVMSNYNGELLIKQTIESVLAQTYQNWEFIIFDDCSTDRSREIIRSFNDPRIKPFFADTHEHMVAGFNYGITNSTGELIARIDSDDTWESEKLQKQVDFFRDHPDYGACFTLVNFVDENGKILTEKDTDRVLWWDIRNKTQAEWLRYFYFYGCGVSHPSAMFPRKIVEEIGLYNLGYVQVQDYDLWIRIVKRYPIHIIQEKLTNYRWFTTGANASAPSEKGIRRANFEFSQVFCNFFDDIPDELFIEAFGADFTHPGTTDPDELIVERMLLFFKKVFCGYVPQLAGAQMFLRLLQDEKMRSVLRDKYELTQISFYEIAAKPIIYEETVFSSTSQPVPTVTASTTVAAPVMKSRSRFLSWLRRRFI